MCQDARAKRAQGGTSGPGAGGGSRAGQPGNPPGGHLEFCSLTHSTITFWVGREQYTHSPFTFSGEKKTTGSVQVSICFCPLEPQPKPMIYEGEFMERIYIYFFKVSSTLMTLRSRDMPCQLSQPGAPLGRPLASDPTALKGDRGLLSLGSWETNTGRGCDRQTLVRGQSPHTTLYGRWHGGGV